MQHITEQSQTWGCNPRINCCHISYRLSQKENKTKYKMIHCCLYMSIYKCTSCDMKLCQMTVHFGGKAATDRSASQGASNVELRCLISFYPKQTVELTVSAPTISEALALMWHHYNEIIQHKSIIHSLGGEVICCGKISGDKTYHPIMNTGPGRYSAVLKRYSVHHDIFAFIHRRTSV